MPELKDIKRFNEFLFSLGTEPQILKERNEEVEEIPVPEDGLPSDVSELLNTPVDNGFSPDTSSTGFNGELDDISLLGTGSDAGTSGMDTGDDLDLSIDIPGIPDTSVDSDDGGTEPPDDLSDTTGDITGNGIGDSIIDDSGDNFDFDSSLTDDIPGDLSLSGDFSDINDTAGNGDIIDDTGTDITPPDDIPGDFSVPDDSGIDTDIPDDIIADLSLPDNLSAITDIDESGDIIDSAGTDIPDDDFGDFSLPDDSGIDTNLLDDIPNDLSLPDDLPDIMSDDSGSNAGTDIIPPDDDLGDFSLLDDSGIDQNPPDDIPDTFSDSIGDFGDISSDDTGTDTTPPDDDLGDFSLPDAISPGTIEPGAEIPPGADSFEVNDEDEFFIDEFSIPEEDQIDALSGIYAAREGEEEKKQFGEVLHEDEDISISEAQLQAIQKTLSLLPLNLKIKVEELIGLGQVTGNELRSLLDLLIKSASPQEIVTIISQITGEKVILPRRFEKKTGIAFEKERRSFTYVLRENLVPLLSIFIPGLIILAVITIGGYNLKIWLDAQDQFKRGIYYIKEEKEFALGNDEFSQAYQKAQDDKWYFRYAEAFTQEHQYEYAREKYEQLLDMKWNEDNIEYIANMNKHGIIDYALFESRTGGNYKKAAALLDYLLFREPYNKQALLAAGDNYLEWSKEDDTYYKAASDMYAKYKNKYGDTPEIMFRYLRFFIETDDYDKVLELKDLFQSRDKLKVDPEVYAQLAGYLMEYNQIQDVRDILARALKANRNIPEIHYQLARYLNIMKEHREEEKALLNAKKLYEALPPLNLYDRTLKHYIDTYNRLGKLYYSNSRTGLAESELDEAIAIIEDRQDKRILGFHKDLGEVYYNRGDIFYDLKDYSAALDYYEKAEKNLYSDPEINYKKGFVYYRDNKYLDSLLEFYKAEKGMRNNQNILFAIGNALYYRGDYFASQGYYTHLLSILEKKRGKIEYIRPDENPAHRSLLNFMMRTYNNLGVTIKKLSEVSRNEKKESEALVYLTKSSEYYDILDRLIIDPESMERDKETRSLPYLNQKHIFYPQLNYSLSIYNTIPLDTHTLDIDDLFSTAIK
ncbi:MAG: hypothetical protein JXB88_06875 [Spirochaetales bacterium]|nr:hypothetical protein [Spirochaetales bacterium]